MASSRHPVPYRSTAVPSRVERQARRQIERARYRSAVVATRGTLKVGAVTEVTKAALVGQGEVAMVAAALVERTPWPDFVHEARYITGTSATSMAGIILEVGHEL
jgi:hypothetical protein